MDWVKIITPPDEVKDAGIPVVPLSATHSYVLKQDIDRISEITGRKPREGAYSYGKFEGVKIDEALPVMVFIHLGKEIVDIFGLKKVYFKKGTETLDGSADPMDARNLFVFIDCVPGGTQVPYDTAPKKLKFGDFEAVIPADVRSTFKLAHAHAKAHIVRDDNGNIIAYSRDNKIWIPFDIGKMENGGRHLNWLPTSVTRLILQRAIPVALTEEPPEPSEEDRIAVLKQSEKEWVRVWTADSKQRIKNIRDQLENNERRYKDLCDQIAGCVNQRVEFSRQLEFEETSGTQEAPAMAEFENLLRDIPELVAIEFSGGTITFRTRMMYLEEDVSRNPYVFEPFPLGEFDIVCQAGVAPVFKNRTRTLKYEGSTWHHPHAKNGHICFGNISAKITEMASLRRWRDVVMLSTQFLKNCTAKDDQWGKMGFKRWQDAGKLEEVNVKHKDAIVPKVVEWAKYVPTVRVYNLKPEDKVLATCPSTCPLLGKTDEDGKPSCPIAGDGKREGVVSDMLDEFVNVKWQHVLEEGGEPVEVDCIGFTYPSIQRLDGEPMFDGDKPQSLYPEQDTQKEIAEGILGVVDSMDKVLAKKLSVLAQQESAEIFDQPESDEEITMDDVERMQDGVENLFG